MWFSTTLPSRIRSRALTIISPFGEEARKRREQEREAEKARKLAEQQALAEQLLQAAREQAKGQHVAAPEGDAPAAKTEQKAAPAAPAKQQRPDAPAAKAAPAAQTPPPAVKKQKQPGAQPHRGPAEVRRVDTRAGHVELDKYNEKYTQLAPDRAVRDNTVHKQKLKQRSQEYRKPQRSKKGNRGG